MSSHNIILVTGATSGIGKACFDHLNDLGHVVYGAGRGAIGSDRMLRVDVTCPDSIQSAVDHILDQHRRIDVLINSAGISIVGAAEDTTIEEARTQMEANFWGVMHMNNAVLPVMRDQKGGEIIHISSLAGLFALPFQSFYSASKYALEGYCESLRMELDPFDIHISLIEPGDFRTAIYKNRIVAENAFSASYRDAFEEALAVIVDCERHGADPARIAALTHKIIEAESPKLRYLTGKPIDVLAARIKP